MSGQVPVHGCDGAWLTVRPCFVVASTPLDAVGKRRHRPWTNRLLEVFSRVHASRLYDFGGPARGLWFGELLLSIGRTNEHRLTESLRLTRHVNVEPNVPRLSFADNLSALT